MRVIISAKSVYPFHPVGGVQKYVYYFAKHLARRGVSLDIVAPLDSGRPRTEVFEGLTYHFLRPAIYRYLEYPIGWLGVHLFSLALNNFLRTKQFDLLHAFDLTGYQYARRDHKRPVIAHVFSDNYLSNPIPSKNPFNFFNVPGSQFDRIKEEKIAISPFADRSTRMKYWAQYYLKIMPMYHCLSRSDAIFYEADVFKDDVNRLYRLDPAKSTVLPVGTDITFIQKSLAAATVSRATLGFQSDDIILITVNRLAADKGVDKVVLALEKIAATADRVKLIIIGSGYQEKEILRLIEKLNLQKRVLHLKGVTENDLYQYYNLADIYISAFSYPGSSISTLEAMACSLPVITTAQPWLVRGGGNGIILKSNSPDLIADAVLQMISRGNLEKQGDLSAEIVKGYSWDNIADKAISKYEEIVFAHAQNG